MQESVANIVPSDSEEEAKIRRQGRIKILHDSIWNFIRFFFPIIPLIFIQLKAKARKVVEIETALRIGDLVALRELAAQKHGLVEGKFSTQLKISELFIF